MSIQDEPRATVLLVGDRDVVHVGLRTLLSRQRWVTHVFSARRGADAVLLAERHAPEVAVIDHFVGDEDGIDICRAIRERTPDVAVLMTSGSATLTPEIAAAAGASGCVAKDCTPAELHGAVRNVAAGARVVGGPGRPRARLSRRQEEILDLMTRGATNARIAGLLGLPVAAVEHHATAIYGRLGVPDRAAAVQAAAAGHTRRLCGVTPCH